MPWPCTRADLLRVHTPAYLRSLWDRRVLARILEVPVVGYLPGWMTAWRVLRPMRWATGGTVLACRLFLEVNGERPAQDAASANAPIHTAS